MCCAVIVDFVLFMLRCSLLGSVGAFECFDSLLRFDQLKLNSLNLLIATKRNCMVAEKIA